MQKFSKFAREKQERLLRLLPLFLAQRAVEAAWLTRFVFV